MSRQLKFRAWLPSENRMEDSKFLIEQWTGLCYYTEPERFKHEEKVVLYEEPVLMQYTGLKDKNGVDIYEGDVLQFQDEDMGTIKAEIYFETCSYCIKYPSTKISFMAGSDAKDYEVIGNRFENPELLTAINPK